MILVCKIEEILRMDELLRLSSHPLPCINEIEVPTCQSAVIIHEDFNNECKNLDDPNTERFTRPPEFPEYYILPS